MYLQGDSLCWGALEQYDPETNTEKEKKNIKEIDSRSQCLIYTQQKKVKEISENHAT